jgi:ribosome-binding protein aMBF1 (putative translation factor)
VLPGWPVAAISLMVYPIWVEWAVDFYQEPDGSYGREVPGLAAPGGPRQGVGACASTQNRWPELALPLFVTNCRDGTGIAYAVWQGQNQDTLLRRRQTSLRSAAWNRETDYQTGSVRTGKGRGQDSTQSADQQEGENIVNRFDRYYRTQMENSGMRELVEKELASLEIGVQIAKLRAKHRLNQTQLAARARMSAPKVSRIESTPANVQLDTLIRLAQALGARLEVRLVEEDKGRRSRRAGAGA